MRSTPSLRTPAPKTPAPKTPRTPRSVALENLPRMLSTYRRPYEGQQSVFGVTSEEAAAAAARGGGVAASPDQVRAQEAAAEVAAARREAMRQAVSLDIQEEVRSGRQQRKTDVAAAASRLYGDAQRRQRVANALSLPDSREHTRHDAGSPVAPEVAASRARNERLLSAMAERKREESFSLNLKEGLGVKQLAGVPLGVGEAYPETVNARGEVVSTDLATAVAISDALSPAVGDAYPEAVPRSYHELLYEEGMLSRAEHQRWAEEGQRVLASKDMAECSFKPRLNPRSVELAAAGGRARLSERTEEVLEEQRSRRQHLVDFVVRIGTRLGRGAAHAHGNPI